VWRKSVFDIYFNEFGAAFTTVLPVFFKYCYKYCYSAAEESRTKGKGNNKITELRAILQRESQNS
jgi:hypothetical protein